MTKQGRHVVVGSIGGGDHRRLRRMDVVPKPILVSVTARNTSLNTQPHPYDAACLTHNPYITCKFWNQIRISFQFWVGEEQKHRMSTSWRSESGVSHAHEFCFWITVIEAVDEKIQISIEDSNDVVAGFDAARGIGGAAVRRHNHRHTS